MSLCKHALSVIVVILVIVTGFGVIVVCNATGRTSNVPYLCRKERSNGFESVRSYCTVHKNVLGSLGGEQTDARLFDLSFGNLCAAWLSIL